MTSWTLKSFTPRSHAAASWPTSARSPSARRRSAGRACCIAGSRDEMPRVGSAGCNKTAPQNRVWHVRHLTARCPRSAAAASSACVRHRAHRARSQVGFSGAVSPEVGREGKAHAAQRGQRLTGPAFRRQGAAPAVAFTDTILYSEPPTAVDRLPNRDPGRRGGPHLN